MLQIQKLTVTLEKNLKAILTDFTFSLCEGDRAVIIGEEGNGKSTLLKLIYDESLVESYVSYTGKILTDGKAGYLSQELTESEKQMSVAEFLGDFCADRPDLRASIAREMGLDELLFSSERILGTLSGGEKVKLRMAKILASEPDILLLDEPTNDIDIKTLRWMERYIISCGLPVLFVSHDETLIERTANVIIHLEQVVHKRTARHTIARMGYREYAMQRLNGIENQDRVARKQREEFKEQQERWRKIHDKVERDQANVSRQNPSGGRLLKKKMKSVKSLEKRFEREQEDFLEIPVVEEAIFMKFSGDNSAPSGKRMLSLDFDTVEAGGKILARNIRAEIFGAEHIGIIGENGVGKTTLLRMIVGQNLSRTDVRCAYMPQDYTELLDLNETPLAFLAPSGKKEDITKARIQMGSMRFTHEEMLGKISELSGGQKAKLLLISMTMRDCNLLLLDEPTRNFSPLSNPVIRRVLGDFPGTILSISHDRKYLAEVCGKVFELTENGLIKREISEIMN